MPNSYCIAIVDDEPGMRLLLRHLFELQGMAVRCYDCAESMLRDDEEVRFGCIVLDLALTGMSGLDLLVDLRRQSSDVPIVMISGRANVADAIGAFKHKVSAFFEKPFNNTELSQTVCDLMSEWVAEQELRASVGAKLADLSPREKEVLDALIAGKKTTQIARELAISPSTVEKHRLHIFAKTQVDSVIGLIHLVSQPTGRILPAAS
jgi:FixJ family two-component response regulator